MYTANPIAAIEAPTSHMRRARAGERAENRMVDGVAYMPVPMIRLKIRNTTLVVPSFRLECGTSSKCSPCCASLPWAGTTVVAPYEALGSNMVVRPGQAFWPLLRASFLLKDDDPDLPFQIQSIAEKMSKILVLQLRATVSHAILMKNDQSQLHPPVGL